MRNFRLIVETTAVLPGITEQVRQDVIDHMVRSVVDGKYWDRWALGTKPELADYFEPGDSMGDTWKVDPESPEFEDHVLRWANARFDQVVEKLSAIEHQGGTYDLHRILFLTTRQIAETGLFPAREGQPRPVSLGLYWTYAPHEWEMHAVWAKTYGKTGADVMFSAKVPASSIDWETTILANMDWHSGDEEFEIRLEQGAPIQVYEIKTYKSVHSSNWDETFEDHQVLNIPSSGFIA